MSNPVNRSARAADQLLDGYYASRNEATPAKEAIPVIRQIRARRPWLRRDELAAEAFHIVCRAKVDVDDLIENFLKIRLEIHDLSPLDEEAGASVYGFADTHARRIAICSRTLAYEPLYRSTAAHEVGHICLHSERRRSVHAYAPEAGGRPVEEREADTFMVALMLPWPIVELSVLATALAWNIDLDEAFAGINSAHGRQQWHERFLPDLSSRCGVSKHMLLLRLLRGRLMTEDTYSHHLKHGSREVYPRAMGGPSTLRIETRAERARVAQAIRTSGSRACR